MSFTVDGTGRSEPPTPDAMTMLKNRLAKGEISEHEFEERR